MTGPERRHLAHLIDQARRKQLHLGGGLTNVWPGCRICGINLDQYTDGCRGCKQRRQKRLRRQANTTAFMPARGQCKQCGVNHHENTEGCMTCKDRHRYRDRIRRRREAMAHGMD